LDIGCNWGYYDTILGELGIKVDALDIDLDYSKLLEHPNITYYRADFLEWTPTKRYDLIIALEIYEHISPPRRTEFMKKIAYSLDDTGYLLFSGPNCISPYYGTRYVKSLVKNGGRREEVDWHCRIPFSFYNQMLTNYYLDILKWGTNGVFLCFNIFEKLLSNSSLQLLTDFDKYISESLRGIGANYTCLLKRG